MSTYPVEGGDGSPSPLNGERAGVRGESDPARHQQSRALKASRNRGSPRAAVLVGILLSALSRICWTLPAADLHLPDEPTLQLPPVGGYQLRVLSPTVLELTLITTKPPDPAPVDHWNFADTNGQLHLPDVKEFVVKAGDEAVPVQAVCFSGRVLNAPVKH